MSGTPEERLADLGLRVPEVAKPVAAYVPAVRSGNYVYTSGQLPMREGQLMLTGKVGGEVSQEEAVECARQCGLNAIAAVRAEVGELSAVKRIVKVVVFVASTPDFTGQPQVSPSCWGRRSVRPVGTPAPRSASRCCRWTRLSRSSCWWRSNGRANPRAAASTAG
jgi:enamine deaminase RidA (YjgF/YER057c/UK114 family)